MACRCFKSRIISKIKSSCLRVSTMRILVKFWYSKPFYLFLPSEMCGFPNGGEGFFVMGPAFGWTGQRKFFTNIFGEGRKLL